MRTNSIQQTHNHQQQLITMRIVRTFRQDDALRGHRRGHEVAAPRGIICIYIYICVYIYTYTYTYNAYTYTYAYTRGKQDRAGGEAVQGSADDTAAHSFHHSNLAKPDADPVTCSDWCCQPKANLVFVCLFVCDADPGHHLVIKSLVNISLRRAMRPSKTGACFSQAPTYV